MGRTQISLTFTEHLMSGTIPKLLDTRKLRTKKLGSLLRPFSSNHRASFQASPVIWSYSNLLCLEVRHLGGGGLAVLLQVMRKHM